jgi:hypothetical protein
MITISLIEAKLLTLTFTIYKIIVLKYLLTNL